MKNTFIRIIVETVYMKNTFIRIIKKIIYEEYTEYKSFTDVSVFNI